MIVIFDVAKVAKSSGFVFRFVSFGFDSSEGVLFPKGDSSEHGLSASWQDVGYEVAIVCRVCGQCVAPSGLWRLFLSVLRACARSYVLSLLRSFLRRLRSQSRGRPHVASGAQL